MEISLQNGKAICVVNDNIVASNVKSLTEILRTALKDCDDYEEIIVDLSKTESIDSMGITFLIALYKKYNTSDIRVKLIGVSDAMLKIFNMLKLVDIFDIQQ